MIHLFILTKLAFYCKFLSHYFQSVSVGFVGDEKKNKHKQQNDIILLEHCKLIEIQPLAKHIVANCLRHSKHHPNQFITVARVHKQALLPKIANRFALLFFVCFFRFCRCVVVVDSNGILIGTIVCLCAISWYWFQLFLHSRAI